MSLNTHPMSGAASLLHGSGLDELGLLKEGEK